MREDARLYGPTTLSGAVNRLASRYIDHVQQDDQQIAGSFSSGDDEFDRKTVADILRRLDNGDVWAWADVTVVARYENWKGYDYLSGCCYEDEDDFRRNSGYFEDMCKTALKDLNDQLKHAKDSLPWELKVPT